MRKVGQWIDMIEQSSDRFQCTKIELMPVAWHAVDNRPGELAHAETDFEEKVGRQAISMQRDVLPGNVAANECD